jgi:hypothetical protein
VQANLRGLPPIELVLEHRADGCHGLVRAVVVDNGVHVVEELRQRVEIAFVLQGKCCGLGVTFRGKGAILSGSGSLE